MCCNFENGDVGRAEKNWTARFHAAIEQLVDELILLANIMVADPPRLPFPEHVQRLIALDRPLRCLDLAKVLLGLDAAFDRAMILLQAVVQILDRSMAAAAAQDSSRFRSDNRRAIEPRPICVDDARLGMRRIAESPAEQALSRSSIAQRRQQKVDGGAGGIDGPIEIIPRDWD